MSTSDVLIQNLPSNLSFFCAKKCCQAGSKTCPIESDSLIKGNRQRHAVEVTFKAHLKGRNIEHVFHSFFMRYDLHSYLHHPLDDDFPHVLRYFRLDVRKTGGNRRASFLLSEDILQDSIRKQHPVGVGLLVLAGFFRFTAKQVHTGLFL